MMIDIDNPAVSSASPDFVAAARDAPPGWHKERWTATMSVIDGGLEIAFHRRRGIRSLIKMNVEGLKAGCWPD